MAIYRRKLALSPGRQYNDQAKNTFLTAPTTNTASPTRISHRGVSLHTYEKPAPRARIVIRAVSGYPP